MDYASSTLLILAAAVLVFAINKLPLAVVAVGVALALYFTGVLSLNEALAGFSDPTVLFIAALFVVSEALEATGVTAWAGQQVLNRAGDKRLVLIVVIGSLSAVLTAFISVNGAVAALLPVVVMVSARANIRTSQLMIPLAFAAHAGSSLVLTGSPVNIIVSDLAAENGGRAFGFFEFAAVGLPLVIGTLAILALFGGKLLPDRDAHVLPVDVMKHVTTLEQHYETELISLGLPTKGMGVAEVVIAPRSALIDVEVTPGMRTPSGDLVLVVAKRGDEIIHSGGLRLAAGDILVLAGDWDDLTRHTQSGDVLVVNAPEQLQRSVPLGKRAGWAIGALAGLVIALATGLMPPAIAALLAAGVVVLSRTRTMTQAFKSVNWTAVVLIAGMIPLSHAFISTGAADIIADVLLSLVGEANPYIALAAICVLTFVLGQIISNTATVLIIAPVALAIAQTLELSTQPFMMALAVAGSASFMTPIATPGNLMVMEPGGYRFGDYWRMGTPLAIFFLVIAVFYVPLIWPFTG